MTDEAKPTPKPLEGKVSVYDMWTRPPQGRILLIEPNDDVARTLEVRLARDGHEIAIADNAQDALAYLEEEVLDVALIDRGLAEMADYALLKKIKSANDPFEVIVMSVEPTVAIAVAAIEAGAFDLVGKPFSNLKLATSKVENAVGKVRAERDRAELARVLYEQTQDLAERETEAELSKSSDLLPVVEDENGIDLDNMAGIDPLTGIPNRRAAEQEFRTETARALRYDRPLCVALGSIDGLSALIETHGREVGDGVLRGVVQLFQGLVRDVDFVARRQGGEFFFLFPETSKDNGELVVDRIRQKIEQTSFSDFVDEGDDEIKVSICFGVAGLPADTMNVEKLKTAGETALRQAKVTGNCVVSFDAAMRAGS